MSSYGSSSIHSVGSQMKSIMPAHSISSSGCYTINVSSLTVKLMIWHEIRHRMKIIIVITVLCFHQNTYFISLMG